MTHSEYLENGYNNFEVSKAHASRMIEQHNLDPQDFFDECGTKDWYETHDILFWLGY